jgi:hypothetical protein
MSHWQFLAIYLAGCILAFMAGHTIGFLRASNRAEDERRWWMNRQNRREGNGQ